MRLLPLRRSLFWSSLVVVLLASAPATADPVDYVIFDSDTRLDLGLFTVDPALAGPSGPSNVTMAAFSITETLGAFGSLTVTLADLAGLSSAPYAQFVDGQIKAISANSQFELAGGIAVNVDMVPENDPLDLNFVAVAQLFAFVPPDFDTTEFGPIRSVGIRTATTRVPEPSTLLLSSIAAGAVVISRRRRRVSERARRQSTSQQRFVHS